MSLNSLIFYGVSLTQLNAALKTLSLSPLAPASDGATVATGEASGETPVGKLTCDLALHMGSGQLTVDIKEKPFLLSVGSIQHHIATALQTAANAPVEPAAVETPAAEEEPAKEPGEPAAEAPATIRYARGVPD